MQSSEEENQIYIIEAGDGREENTLLPLQRVFGR